MTVIVSDRGSIYYHEINSIAEYIDYLENIRKSKRLFFRGLSNFTYDLSPSLNRRLNGDGDYNWLTKESRLVQFAEQSIPDMFVKTLPTILLSNMQHYDIPTRMMDITENALVALFFACHNHPETDGKVVVFDDIPVSAYNSFANIIADTYHLTNNSIVSVEQYLYLLFQQEYASTLLYPNWENNLDKAINEYLPILEKPMLIDVGVINPRQRNQTGKFILFPNQIKEGNILNKLVTIDECDTFVHAVIKIPKNQKQRIENQLRLLGVTESFLFPDDVSKVFSELKNVLKSE